MRLSFVAFPEPMPESAAECDKQSGHDQYDARGDEQPAHALILALTTAVGITAHAKQSRDRQGATLCD